MLSAESFGTVLKFAAVANPPPQRMPIYRARIRARTRARTRAGIRARTRARTRARIRARIRARTRARIRATTRARTRARTRAMTRARGLFLEAPGNYRARQAVLFSIPDGSFKSFENSKVKLLAKETKRTSLEVRTHPTFLETLTGP